MRAVQTCVLFLSWWGRGGAATAPERGDAVRGALAAGGMFSLQSAVLLNAAERRDRELGYRLAATLAVAPGAPPPGAAPGDSLLCFTLSETRLEVRGGGAGEWAARGSAWDAQRGAASAWCALLRRGALATLLLRRADPPDVRDYKRALASLFQFQGSSEGGAWRSHNETDALGACLVTYEPAGGSGVRKVRRACAGDAAAGVGPGGARRATRLALAPGGDTLAALHAEEVLTLHDALKARSYHTLARLGPAPAAAPAPAPADLEPHALALEAAAASAPLDEDLADLGSVVEAARAALEDEEAGAGGRAAGVRALLRLLPALRRAEPAALHRELARAERAARAGLCRALGLAGSAAAARAALRYTRLESDEPLEPLARAFLAGFALAARADRDAVLEVARAAGAARRAALAERALAAAAAAARGAGERAAVREAAARALARCREPACRAARLLALANLRAEPPDAVLEEAERGGRGAGARAAAAALAVLRAAPALSAERLERLARLAANGSAALETRAAALDAVVARRAASAVRAAPLPLVELARALLAERGRAAHELRRLLWQRLDALRDAPPVRELLRLLPRDLRTWDARAHAGTSHVLVRETGWGGGAGGWAARLDSVQVAAGGLLRRGSVALLVEPPAGRAPPPVLEVEVWTRGLHALAGGGAGPDGEEGEEEEEGVAGGLALSVAGYRIHDVVLFEGQAELLGHVWAGTGSTPTAVLRALRVVHEAEGALPLLGGCAVRVRARAALALALDAHAAVSLWQRTARGALALRAALAAEAEARVRVAWGELRARRDFTAEPRLRIALALDFYDGVAACVRASVPAHEAEDALRLSSVLGARRANVTRGARARRHVPARTLALGRTNDAACRTLQAGHDDEDDEH